MIIMDVTIHGAALAHAGPYGIAVGPDDAIWLTLVHSGQVARLDPDGETDVFDLGAPDCRPMVITAGPEGALWFTRSGDDRIGRITVDGEHSSFAVAAGSHPYGIVAGPDGCLWFTQMGGNSIGRIDLAGRSRASRCPSPTHSPPPSRPGRTVRCGVRSTRSARSAA